MRARVLSTVAMWAIVSLLAIAGAFGSGCVSPGRSSPDERTARTGFDPATIDLGRQAWHASVPFSSKLVNREEGPVIVAAVRSDCGCTGINPKRYVGKTIAPGEWLEVAGELSTGGRLGRRSAEVELMLTSGAIHVLTLEYDAYATYSYLPTALQFEAVDLDNDEEAVQSVIFSSPTARIIGDVAVDRPWLQIARHDRGDGETELAVRVVKENLPHGTNYATVTVKTTDPFKPEFSFRVTANGVARVLAKPGHLFLRSRQEGVVFFVDSEGRFVVIESVESEWPTGFDAYIRPGDSSLSVRFLGETPPDETQTIWVRCASGARCRFLVSVVSLRDRR